MLVWVLPVGGYEEAVFVSCSWTSDLFDEAEEGGDDDGRLEGFSEDDEEDGDAEEILAHGCLSAYASRVGGKMGWLPEFGAPV